MHPAISHKYDQASHSIHLVKFEWKEIPCYLDKAWVMRTNALYTRWYDYKLLIKFEFKLYIN